MLTITALTALLAPFFIKAGETLATESVKLALEKREDIKNGFLELFKRDELVTLGLNEKSPEEIKALVETNPPEFAPVVKIIEENRPLLDQLLEVIRTQAGGARVSINAEKIGQVVTGDHHHFDQTFNL